ncbi:MAG TPA: ABC transporter substrate-binding protein [Rhizobacter sp.]|nr:ABC transporter substrate-binding protein [Rhizobacter sp.]
MDKQRKQRRQVLRGVAAAAGSAMLGWNAHAQDSREIRIGQSAVLSGPLAPSVMSLVKGQDLALDEINRKGGIGGRRVRFIALDDAYDPKKTVENVTTLIDKEKVVALTGFTSASSVAAALPLLAEKKVPLIGAYSGSPSLRAKHNPYLFTLFASYRDELVQMIRTLVSAQRTQLGVIYQNHPFGQLMLPVVEEVAREQGATLVGRQPLENNGSDAVNSAHALGQSKPQAVLLLAFGPSIIGFIKAARSYVGAPIYALSIANAKPIVAALGDDARGIAFTQVIPYPFRQTSPLTRDFAAAMERENIEIDYDHFFGYMNVRVLAEGLKRAAASGRGVTSESLIAGMESIGKLDMGGYPINFGPQRHHGSSFVDLTIVGPRGRYMR